MDRPRTAMAVGHRPSAMCLPKPGRRQTIPSSAHSFTLVELLVVIAIMAIIIGLAAPAYNSITRGTAVTSGTIQIASSVAAARQRAITKQNRAAIVFSYTNSAGEATTNENAQFAVSYTTVERVTNSWQYVDQWRHLPKGAFFSKVPSSTLDIPFPTNGSATIITGIPSVEFKSWGVPTAACIYEVREGTILPGTTKLVNSNAYNAISSVVYRVTGSIKILK